MERLGHVRNLAGGTDAGHRAATNDHEITPRQLAGAESLAPRRSHALAEAADSSPERNAASTATTKQWSMRRSCSRVQPPCSSSPGLLGARTSKLPPF